MKRIFLLALTLAFVLPASLRAQEKTVPPAKELKQLMRELSPEMQQEVVEYARRKLAVQERLAAQAQAAEVAQAAPAPAPEQPQAKPAPQPAQPAALELKPAQATSTATMNAGATTQPARPDWLVEAENMPNTTVEWYETSFDFGKITPGAKVQHTFRFKNTGDQPLKITRVKPSCGCTSPNWSKEEIAPGEEGFVEVIFNSAGKTGMQHKTVTVTGNFDPMNMTLRFRGEITAEAGQ